MNPIFEDNELLKDMSPEKRAFICEIIEDSKKIQNKNQLLPYFKELIMRSKKQNITFTQDEIQFLVQTMKANATAQESNTIDKIIQYSQDKKN